MAVGREVRSFRILPPAYPGLSKFSSIAHSSWLVRCGGGLGAEKQLKVLRSREGKILQFEM